MHLKKGKQKFISIIKSIAKQSGLELSYSEQFIPLNKTISVYVTKLTAKEALLRALKGTTLRYAVYSNQLVLLEKNKIDIQAASDTVLGIVKDGTTGETLPGVNVIIKGTTRGTSTDQKGHFTMTVPSLQDTLVFSYIGYRTLEFYRR